MKRLFQVKSSRKANQLLCAVFAALETMAIGYIAMEVYGVPANGGGYLVVFPAMYYVLKGLQYQRIGKKDSLYLLFAVLFWGASIVSLRLEETVQFGTWEMLLIFIVMIPLMAGTVFLLKKARGFLHSLFYHETVNYDKSDWKFFATCMLILLLCWFPVLLAYYPGLFNYDVAAQISQYWARNYNTHHPLVHTLILSLFWSLGGRAGSYNLGILWYTLAQMVFMSACISWLMLYLHRCRIHPFVKWGTLFLMSIVPFVPILVISATKDIFFGGAFLVACVCLCYLQEAGPCTGNKLVKWLYVLSVIGVCLFRNNGKYALGLFCMVCLLCVKKQKNTLILSIVGIAIAMIVNQGMVNVLHAGKGSQNEMLSVPYQQMAYTANYCSDHMTEQEFLEITKFIPDYDKYDKSLADAVKGTGRVSEDEGEFLRVYFKYMTKYPKQYITAFLHLCRGYWDISDLTFADIYGDRSRHGYLLTDTKEGYGVEHITKFPYLEELYEQLFSDNEYQKFPLISVIFSPAFYTWIILMLIVFSVMFRKPVDTLLPTMMVLIYFAGVLLGPCCLIRYAFPYIICVPCLCCTTFDRAKM